MYIATLAFGFVLWIGLCFRYLRSSIGSAFHPISFYLFFHGLIFVLRPILAYCGHYDAMYRGFEFQPTEDIKTRALLMCDLGAVVFVFVSERVARTPIFAAIARPPAPRVDVDRLRVALVIAVLLCLPLGGASIWRSITTRHLGTSTMVVDAATGFTVNTSDNGYFLMAGIMMSTIGVLIAWAWRFKPLALLPFIAIVVAQSSTGGRWPFVMATASLLLLYLLDRRLRWPTPRAIAIGVAVIVLFNVVGADRGATVRSWFTGEKIEQRIDGLRPFEGEDFANMEFNEFIVGIIPEKTQSYNYFADNLILFTGPIPRAWWPQKPIGSPIQFYSIFKYGRPSGMTYSLPGNGWAQYGWLGVMIWCAFGAYIVSKPYEIYVRGRRTLVQTVAYCMFVPLTLLFYRDGGFPELLTLAFFVELPILAWVMVTRLLAPSRDSFTPVRTTMLQPK